MFMAAVEDSNPDGGRRSVQRCLGEGLLADVLLWRRRNAAIALLGGSTSSWLLFEKAEYNLPTLIANALLLLVVILFFWARAASLLNRPLPPLPNLEISEEVVGKAADEARVWINRALGIARGIAIARDRRIFLQVMLVLWVVSFMGGVFNFFTLVYIGVLLALSVPVLYEKYHVQIDEKLVVAHRVLSKQYDNIMVQAGRKFSKEKTQ